MAHGRYTIVGKLADGGMAEIFLAMQHGAEGFQKPVALKRVLSAFSADPQFRNMFLDEAHISMSLSHGNIVQVLDVGVAGDRTFLVLELVEGWDLERVMERAQATGPDHPWPPSLALYVTAQICRGLAYAHAKRGADGRALGIVHRDVSPTNVLISEQGEVKLADFGIAKAEKKREQTLAGVIKGKIGFMSPEQALGRPLDARADLFSVGTVMYLMLTGRRPFDAGSELESMTKAQRAEYRPPEELNPYLSPEATTIVGRAMRRDPSDRYQTADEMLVDVERVLRSEYHSAGQTELKRWLSELARRDGVVPMGRVQPPSDGDARPVFVDEHGDLSAGSSLELSDVHGSSAPTAVAGPPPRAPGMTPAMTPEVGAPAVTATVPTMTPRSVPGESASQTVRSVAGPTATPTRDPFGSNVHTPATVSPLTAAPPTAALSTPVAGQVTPPTRLTLPPSRAPSPTGVKTRLQRRGRVGLGFVLGAVCMLGVVFGIRWLAQWAGREHLALPPWYQKASGDTAAGPGPAGPGAPPVASPAGTVPTESPGGAGPGDAAGVAGSAPTPASVSAQSPAQAGSANPTPPDGGATRAAERDAGVAAAASITPSPGEAASPSPASGGDLDDDEDRLLGRMVPDAGAVIGEDEAEDKGPAKQGTTKQGTPQQGDSAKADVQAKQRPAGPSGGGSEKSKTPSPSRAQGKVAARPAPVQIRITTSPLGAVVRSKKHVLGRTPLAVRFNPGNTYELTFVKSGYVTHSRRLAVAVGKSKSISVAMKKKPSPPRRSFFGGR